MSTLRVGIIGTGSRGITCIGRQIAEQSKELDITITAFCNRTESRMEIARDELNELAVASGNPPLSIRFHATAQQLINDPEVDLIVITSPTAAHAEATIPALRSGKKVYLDKPIAHTLEDSIAIRNAEVEAGNPMIMGFTRRYETPWLKLR